MPGEIRTIETTVQLRCGAPGRGQRALRRVHRRARGLGTAGGGDRLMGRGVLQAVSHVEGEIAQALIGKSP